LKCLKLRLRRPELHGQSSTETLKTLEKETLTLLVDKNDSTYEIEDWESLLPSLPESLARFARSITHGELNSRLSIFSSSTWTATLVAKILEVYCIAKRAAKHNEMLKVHHPVQRGGSMTQLQEEDRGQPQNWFALIVMHHGELFPSVFFARALLPLT
jgi:hypothetical protein